MAQLYDLSEYKDNCGFGLIAHIKGHTSHQLVRMAIEALTRMIHRGDIAADGRWRNPFTSWPTMAKSTPSLVTVTGQRLALVNSTPICCPTLPRFSPW